jgi:glutathione S-transferase
MFTLYTTPLSANGRKVLALAHHLGLDPEVKIVNVYAGEGRSPEFLAVNPAGKIPVLVSDGFVLTESNAILQFLAEAHGDFKLWSRDPRSRADISRWLFWEASQWQPALVPVLQHHVAQRLGLVPGAPAAVVDWTDAGFQRVVEALDAHLRTRAFLMGDELSIADLSVAGMMTYARSAAFPFDRYEGIARWYARIEALDAWQATETKPWSTP